MINLTKQQFAENMKAIINSLLRNDEIDKFLESLSSSYFVLDPSPAENRLLELTEEMMEDKEKFIDWYLFEDVEKVVNTAYGLYTVDTVDELFYLIAILCHEEDDIAYYVADHITALKLSELAGMELYMYVCKNYDSLIEKYKDQPEYANLVVELKCLKHAIESGK